MSKRPFAGDGPTESVAQILVVAAEKMWEGYTVCKGHVSDSIMTEIEKSMKLLNGKGLLSLRHDQDPESIKYVITFSEWFSRLVIAIYGSVKHEFHQWPFALINEASKILFNNMKTDRKDKCLYFCDQFARVLVAISAGYTISDELLMSHIEKMPNVFPRIPLNLKSYSKDSLIIGMVKLISFFRKECNVPSLLGHEFNGLFDLVFLNNGDELKLAIFQLFTTCSDCVSWSYNKVEEFVEVKFGSLLSLETQSIIDKSPEFQVSMDVLIKMIEMTKNQTWIEVFLFLLIRMVWKAEPEVGTVVKECVLQIGQLFMAPKASQDPGFKMFRKHAEYLLPKIVRALAQEEENDESTHPVGKMMRKAILLFGLEKEVIGSFLLPMTLIHTLLLGSKEAQDAFVDIKNEFHEIDFKNFTSYFPFLVARIMNGMKISEIADSLPFLLKVWDRDSVWPLLFSNSRVITEVLLNYSCHKEMVYYFLEQYVTTNSTPASQLEFDASEKFMKSFFAHFDLMKAIIFEINERVTPEPCNRILRHEGAIRSLISFINIVQAKGVTQIQTTLGSLLKQLTQLDELVPNELDIIAELYYAFINNLEKQDLELNADHLCKDLVLIMTKAETKAVEALKLIILKKGLSDETLSKISFLPLNRPALEPVHVRIDQAIEKQKESKDDVVGQVIKYSDEVIDTDETDMKQLRLETLRDFIKKNYQKLTNVGDYTSSWMIKVYSNLISDSRLPDKIIRKIVAECMGHIGAIDPSRFDQIPYSSSETEITNFDVSSDEFAAQLLNLLAELLAKKHTRNVFEITVAYFITIRELKDVFSSKQFDFVLSKIPTKYQTLVKEAVENKAKASYKVFHELETLFSNKIFTLEIKYEEWLRKWAKRMIKHLSDTSNERRILEKCAVLFNSDYRLAEMLLPCIVYHFLTSSTISDTIKAQVVDNEIHSIINSAIPPEAGVGTFEVSSPLETRITVSAISLNQTQHSCAQQIFALFDRLSQERNHESINKSLSKMSFIQLAHLAYGCQSYSRSLLYLEQHVSSRLKSEAKAGSKIELMDNEIHLLQKIYVAVDDPDGVEGVNMNRKSEPDIMDRILAHEATNHLDDALACCEKGVQSNPDDVDYIKMMLRCLLSMDQPSTAYKYSLGLITENDKWTAKVKPYMIEATWKLGKWDKLEELTSNVTSEEGNTSLVLGQILTCIKKKDTANFETLLDKARIKEMNPISAMASQRAAYLRSYQHLIRLHMFSDLERASSCLLDMKTGPEERIRLRQSFDELNHLLSLRNDSILQSLRTLEPVLSLQRVLYDLAQTDKGGPDDFSEELATSWLLSAKLARKSGNVQRAYHCLLETQDRLETVSFNLNLVSDFLIETSKHGCIRRDPDSKEKALKELNRGISKYFDKYFVSSVPGSPRKASPHTLDKVFLRAYSKAKLLSIRMTDEMENIEKRDVVAMYSELVGVDDNWEKPHFYLAKLYDRISSVDENVDKCEKIKSQHSACLGYFNSLKQGCKYSQESLPRLLELYFEMSSSLEDNGTSNRGSKGHSKVVVAENPYLKSTSGYVEGLATCVPSYVLYTAFSQIMSRFNHSSEKVCQVLTTLMESLVAKYPRQVMWRLMVFAFMPKDEKALKYQIVLDKITKGHLELYRKMLSVTKALIHVSEFQSVDSEADLHMHYQIFRVFSNDNVPILVPSTRHMRVTLPASGLNEESHEAFDPKLVFITGVNKRVHLLSSLARPKRICFFTSCGANFNMMIKPKDDLRVDSRTLEFCDFINRLLKKDPETRKRRLSIRTFQVIPLSYNAGLVEWVDGLRDIRSIILSSYEKYRGIKNLCLRNVYPSKGASSSYALKRFRTTVLPGCSPPVFRQWFLDAFPDATSWQLARINYVRSTAVMCMVGYIIGLGDRHLENILLDQTSGEIVHVDFNCLFNRGERLEVPEVVPFRLTQNLVDAMGLTGYEGHFRRTCEETLRVLRANRDMLMSVLNPFVFDPFVGAEQPKVTGKGKATGRKSNIPESMINEDSKGSIEKIKDRLNGIVMMNDQRNPFPLSVSGQVNHLIEMASDDARLCRMFVGWASWL